MKRNRTIEQRILPLDVELRAGEGEEEGKLVGHAAVFNQWTTISSWFGDGWEEQMAPGAFRKTIKEADIRALWNHDPNIVLGRNKAGTLALREDDSGLAVTIDPPDNEWGRPVMDAVKRGDVSGMSIAFQVVKEEWTKPTKDDAPGTLPKRTIKEAKLFDVSPVTFPAFPQTDVSARAEASEEERLRAALRLGTLAGMGLALDDSERQSVRSVADWLVSVSGEPEAVHSPAVPQDEPADTSHSAEARARRLRILSMAMEDV